MRRINKKGLALIKEFEGYQLEAYLCPAGVWTIGYGHTLSATPGMLINETKAEELLREDLREAEEAVDRLVTVPINDKTTIGSRRWCHLLLMSARARCKSLLCYLCLMLVRKLRRSPLNFCGGTKQVTRNCPD